MDDGVKDVIPVHEYYVDRNIDANIITIPGGERAKRAEVAEMVCDRILTWGIDRRAEPLVVIGGGATLDLGGHVAATVLRGVPWVAVPTTLLAMIDTALGAKVALNHHRPSGLTLKNKIGNYHPASLRLLDPTLLATLPANLMTEGLMEMAKAALVLLNGALSPGLHAYAAHAHTRRFADPDGELILRGVIGATVAELASDLFEDELARLLDFGHTFAHELEGRSDGRIPHGIAVGHDIALTAVISRDRELITRERCEWVLDLLYRLGMPGLYSTLMTADMIETALDDRTRHRGGKLRMVMLTDTGNEEDHYTNTLTVEEVMRAVRLLAQFDSRRT
ncbi:hypothetical protein [Streptomyces sp. TRM70350]|uniref:3-dehydroquinate synthase family protein n=1 Tax=Streptomyces sp. TRM70350 TaxID=2856165 RepID=UPI001C481AD2|nr:hypothetical protein [Streptomyces sp. TRM70350]MBV7697643.1 hypothetical protein [Streptomyces sp. TRM70350]